MNNQTMNLCYYCNGNVLLKQMNRKQEAMLLNNTIKRSFGCKGRALTQELQPSELTQCWLKTNLIFIIKTLYYIKNCYMPSSKVWILGNWMTKYLWLTKINWGPKPLYLYMWSLERLPSKLVRYSSQLNGNLSFHFHELDYLLVGRLLVLLLAWLPSSTPDLACLHFHLLGCLLGGGLFVLSVDGGIFEWRGSKWGGFTSCNSSPFSPPSF